MLRCLMPLDQLEAALAEVGISGRGRFVPVDAVLQGADYFDPRGPASAAWRAGDSIWALVSEAELAAMTRTLGELDCRGQLGDYLAEHDRRRPEIGQITVLYGIKG